MGKRTISFEVDGDTLEKKFLIYSDHQIEGLRDSHRLNVAKAGPSFDWWLEQKARQAACEAELERRAEARRVTVDTPPGTFVMAHGILKGVFLTVGINPLDTMYMITVDRAGDVKELELSEMVVAEVQGWEQ